MKYRGTFFRQLDLKLRMGKINFVRKIVFLILFFCFLNRLINSCLKWNTGNVGTIEKKAQADYVTYPSISICFLPHNMKNETMVSKNGTWNFNNAAIDKVIQIKQHLLKNGR